MTKAEAQVAEDMRTRGFTWGAVGITFGLADEACRSAYRRAKCKEIADNLKADGCSLCGERNPHCLDFHHPDPAIKANAISDIMSRNAVISEAAKCFILCSNCHRKLHRTLYGLYNKIEKLTEELQQIKDEENISICNSTGVGVYDAYSSEGTDEPSHVFTDSSGNSYSYTCPEAL